MMPFASGIFKLLTDTQQQESEEKEVKNEEVNNGKRSRRGSKSDLIHATVNSMNENAVSIDKEAIRIKAKCDHTGVEEVKSMTVDPNITSFASLYLLIKRAFMLKKDFDISYLLPKSPSNISRPDVYLSLLSDWDLDAAFHTASIPYLELKVETASNTKDIAEWFVLEEQDAPSVQDIVSGTLQLPFSVSLRHEVSKQFHKVKDVFVDVNKTTPVTEREWVNYFDSAGRIISPNKLRIRVFHGGLEASLRREGWVHLLGVYPSDLTTEERTRFLFMKTQVYKHLKEDWLARIPQEIESITHMVQKDVLRTDRSHPFFNVPDHHPNLVSLFNVLTTFALHNPDISYCQGMSDLAAPLLVVTEDETLCYLCFCKVMERLKSNFLVKNTALIHKFGQLSLLLQRTDFEFFTYLQDIEGGNLYFCYRMLLLELKREFPFMEALRVMEIIWSSVPLEADDEIDERSFFSSLIHATTKNSTTGRSSPAAEGLYRLQSDNKLDKETIKLDPLPHPKFLNDGSPFPLFMCLAILLMHRNTILTEEMDYAILAMYFDKLSRRHDCQKVLQRAKALYFEYLNSYLDGQTINPNENEDDDDEQKTFESLHGTESTAAQC